MFSILPFLLLNQIHVFNAYDKRGKKIFENDSLTCIYFMYALNYIPRRISGVMKRRFKVAFQTISFFIKSNNIKTRNVLLIALMPLKQSKFKIKYI